MKKKIINYSILFVIFLSLSQITLVFVFNHYLTIDYSLYELPPQNLQMLNLADQKLYLRENLHFLNSILTFLLLILFCFIHLFYFFLFRKEKLIFPLAFCFIYIMFVCCIDMYFHLENANLWQFFIYLAFILFFIYIFLLDKFFQSHLFKIYFIFIIVGAIFLRLDLGNLNLYFEIIKSFLFPIHLFILFILMRKKEF
ncbi:hypothetical protein [Campylobacter jejuni]|uniref:hypothetical protein n=1 Tax=Campylobacter jejuni TaxID=197 RepID=UPI0008741C3E|nr:hypothetical protein [Campylobacter jejuni]EAL2420891.1 hypothetical protein [Campylobacter jejuni]OEW28313.1 hypothetical protein AJ877_04175 [Campylobacter jejuni]